MWMGYVATLGDDDVAGGTDSDAAAADEERGSSGGGQHRWGIAVHHVVPRTLQ